MTDSDIVKAFESLFKKLLNVKYELKITRKELLALNRVDTLIKRQQAEIERLKGYNENLQTANVALSNEILDIKTEAIKEFAERLKEKSLVLTGGVTLYGKIVTVSKIDNLVKEMTEDGLDDRS